MYAKVFFSLINFVPTFFMFECIKKKTFVEFTLYTYVLLYFLYWYSYKLLEILKFIKVMCQVRVSSHFGS